MRETETSLQQFGEYLLREQLAPQHVALHLVRWVRRFLSREATDEPPADQARRFCDDLARSGTLVDWQVRQAEQVLRLYFVSFLERTDWHRRPAAGLVDDDGRTDPPRAIDEMRRRLRTRHCALRTESAYVDWAGRFFAYQAERQAAPHPRVDASSVRAYLTHLAVRRRVSASTQNQAFCALLFLCRGVLGVDVDGIADAARARRGERLPTVMSVPETAALLAAMRGTPRLMACLIYGGGLCVSECCELRVKDLDFDQGLVLVRSGKGDKDRATLMADDCRDDLKAQLAACERLHRADRAAGLAGVWLPDPVERKYRNAGLEFDWFWVFPSRSLSTDPRAGIVRRHHLDESVVQKAVRAAATAAGIHKPVSVHTLRHCFATHLLLNGVDIQQIQEYLGHVNVETTTVYTHVVRDLRNPPRSPLDVLREAETRQRRGACPDAARRKEAALPR